MARTRTHSLPTTLHPGSLPVYRTTTAATVRSLQRRRQSGATERRTKPFGCRGVSAGRRRNGSYVLIDSCRTSKQPKQDEHEGDTCIRQGRTLPRGGTALVDRHGDRVCFGTEARLILRSARRSGRLRCGTIGRSGVR